MGTRAQYANWSVDSEGAIIASSAVEVRRKADNSLATLYTTVGGGTTKTNPFNAEVDGSFEFFVEPDRYDLLVGVGGSQSTVPLDLIDARQNLTYTTRAEFVAWVAGGGDAPEGSISHAAGLSYIYTAGATDISDLADWLPHGTINPLHFGDNTTPGTTNITTILTACHTYANTINSPVSYAGIATYVIDPDQEIPINTSVDFANAYMVIDGIVATPSFGAQTNAYLVEDSTTPFSGAQIPVTGSNFVEGSTTPCADFMTDAGFAYILAQVGTFQLIPSRDRLTTRNFRWTCATNYAGAPNYPFPIDMSGVTEAYCASRQNTRTGRIILENININMASFNNANVFWIARNEVTVQNVTTFPPVGAALPTSVSRVVKIYGCAYITLRDWDGTAQQNPGSDGTYLFGTEFAAEIVVEDMRGQNGWGIMGTNATNGFYVRNCNINRIDAHDGAHNYRVSNCTVHDTGFGYGWGTGFLHVSDSEFDNCPPVYTRVDYGGGFWGDIIVADCHMRYQNFTPVAVDLEIGHSIPTGTALLAIPCPNVIVSNLTVSSISSQSYIELISVRMILDAVATQPPLAPILVSVDNVQSGNSFFHSCIIDYANFSNTSPAPDNYRWNISNVGATRVVNSVTTQGVITLPNTLAAATFTNVRLHVEGCQNFSGNTDSVSGTHYIDNSEITDFTCAAGRRTYFTGCHFIEPKITNAVIGGTGAGSSGFATTISGGHIRGAWDLSNVYAMSGVYIPNATGITFPAGATSQSAFTGWQIGERLVSSEHLVIADDGIATLTPPGNGGLLSVQALINNNGVYPEDDGLIYYDVGVTPSIELYLTGGSVSSTLDVTTTDVSVTPGASGNVTVCAIDGALKIHNRTGNDRDVHVKYL